MLGIRIKQIILAISIANLGLACGRDVEPRHPVRPQDQVVTPRERPTESVPTPLSLTSSEGAFRAVPYDQRCDALSMLVEEFAKNHLKPGTTAELENCIMIVEGWSDDLRYKADIRLTTAETTANTSQVFGIDLTMPRNERGKYFSVILQRPVDVVGRPFCSKEGEDSIRCEQKRWLGDAIRTFGDNFSSLLPTLINWIAQGPVIERVGSQDIDSFVTQAEKRATEEGIVIGPVTWKLSPGTLSALSEEELTNIGWFLEAAPWRGTAEIVSIDANARFPDEGILNCYTADCLQNLKPVVFRWVGNLLLLSIPTVPSATLSLEIPAN